MMRDFVWEENAAQTITFEPPCFRWTNRCSGSRAFTDEAMTRVFCLFSTRLQVNNFSSDHQILSQPIRRPLRRSLRAFSFRLWRCAALREWTRVLRRLFRCMSLEISLRMERSDTWRSRAILRMERSGLRTIRLRIAAFSWGVRADRSGRNGIGLRYSGSPGTGPTFDTQDSACSQACDISLIPGYPPSSCRRWLRDLPWLERKAAWCALAVSQWDTIRLITPRPAGGGVERPPLRFFEDSEKTAARSAAGFSPTLPPIFPQLLWKFRPNAMWGQVTRSGQVTQLQNNFPIAPRLQCFRESYETFGIWWGHQCLQNVYLGFLISVT